MGWGEGDPGTKTAGAKYPNCTEKLREKKGAVPVSADPDLFFIMQCKRCSMADAAHAITSVTGCKAVQEGPAHPGGGGGLKFEPESRAVVKTITKKKTLRNYIILYKT